jgi:hypothetical protein
MAASWDWSDEKRLRSVVVVEDFPAVPPVTQPTEWDTDDGLGVFKGLFNAFGFVAAAWAVVIGLYFLVR